ncbi:MAG: hypothetical protein ISR76_08050 [Planctomycetes bacterium]|nr:hypothetical protein [Planctomycetota bacterium]
MKPLFSVLGLSLLASCASTHREIHTTDRPLGEIRSLNDYVVDIQIASEPVLGKAAGGTVLGLFIIGDTDYADAIGFDGDSFNLLSSILGSSRLDELKRAAIRDACAASSCEVLAYPTFRWNESSNPFVTQYTVEVKGYPGFIKEIKNIRREVKPGMLQLGPNDDPVPPGNRYRVEAGDGATLQVGMGRTLGAAGSGGLRRGAGEPMTDRPFGWRG